MTKATDLVGKQFGWLTVISFSHTEYDKCGTSRRVYNTVCKCGNEEKVKARYLIRMSKSKCKSCKSEYKKYMKVQNAT